MRFGLREAIYILLLLAMPASAYLTVFKQRAVSDLTAKEEIMQVDDKIKRVSKACRARSTVFRACCPPTARSKPC